MMLSDDPKEYIQDDLGNKDLIFDTLLTEAIHDLSAEMMKKLGIDIIKGTMMKVTILQVKLMWEKYKWKMLEATEKLELLVKSIVEDAQDGILVKITPESLLCFFPDKQRGMPTSISRSICAANGIYMHLLNDPIRLEDEVLRTSVCLSYGPVYKRALHIQKKILYDYHGSIVDDVLYKCKHLEKPQRDHAITICGNDTMIKHFFQKKRQERGQAKPDQAQMSKTLSAPTLPQ